MLSRVALISFSTKSARDRALKIMQDARLEESAGQPLLCKPALTFSSRERNNALRRALKLAQDFSKETKANLPLEIDWKNRTIVNGQFSIFQQSKEGLGGIFSGNFAHLRLR